MLYNTFKKSNNLQRKRCRSFLSKEVSIDDIYVLLESARWAPSGKNGQPWRFVIVKDKVFKSKLSNFSLNTKMMQSADTFIVVYLEQRKTYNYKKDLLAVGAAIENICLQATEMGLGTWWIGDVLEKQEQINNLLEVPKFYELIAIICIGYENKSGKRTDRLVLDEIIYKLI